MLNIFVLRKFKEYIADIFNISTDEIHHISSTMIDTDNFEVGVELINYQYITDFIKGDDEKFFQAKVHLIFLSKSKKVQVKLISMLLDAIIESNDLVYSGENCSINIVKFRREKLDGLLNSYEFTLEYRYKQE